MRSASPSEAGKLADGGIFILSLRGAEAPRQSIVLDRHGVPRDDSGERQIGLPSAILRFLLTCDIIQRMWRTLIFLILAAIILYVGYTYPPDFSGQNGEEAVITGVIADNADGNNNANINNNGMQIQDIKIGTGASAESGKQVTVHYVGTLTNGTKFDSSRDRGTPFTFNLGAGEVIEGWDKGVAGMKVGGVRKLTIPPDLAYGARAVGSIPANSTLVFEVELLGVK